MHVQFKKISRNKALLLAGVLLAVAAGYFVVQRLSGNGQMPEGVPAGYIEETNYVHPKPGEPVCAAILPACGDCRGMVVDQKCYIRE
jgi:hypothetical protein